jgi:hypothetical protein
VSKTGYAEQPLVVQDNCLQLSYTWDMYAVREPVICLAITS